MNREIKFRYNHNGEMKCYALYDIMYGYVEKSILHPEDYRGEFVGLNDIKGKEIYEGDILVSKGIGKLSGSKPNNIGHMPTNIPHKVFFHEGAFKFRHNKRSINHCLSGLTIRYFSLEVIGNIYETPHLLNSEQSVKESDTSKAT